ncbi:hypothetical protein JCM14076_28860 [Methylosoma difficile]
MLNLFSSRQGATVKNAVASYFRLTNKPENSSELKRVHQAITDMLDCGVLIDNRTDTSRYTAQIVEDYLNHRPFPNELAEFIIRQSQLQANSRVLDLAGGPGDLALLLAQTSQDVSLMELSKGFLQSACERAKQMGVNLTPLHESCNRLPQLADEFDVITVSQALHWLDDVQICRGVCRLLSANGHFFVIHSIIELDGQHPLAYLLGDDSILGKKTRQSFNAEVQPLFKRLSLLFDALDAPDVQRIDLSQPSHNPKRIVPVNVSLFKQNRPFDLGFARGFLTPEHLANIGQSHEDFWQDLTARCNAASPEQLLGKHYWGILEFQRGGTALANLDLANHPMTDIGFTPRVKSTHT